VSQEPAAPQQTAETPAAARPAGERPVPPPASSAAGRPHWAVFVGLAALILVVDQLVKAWILGNFTVETPVNVIGTNARIVLSQNNGALFGMFRDQALLFAFFSLGVIALIVWYHGHAGDNLLVSVALGLLLGGALGNLTDRLRLGYVVDFVDLGIGTWRWYTFNVADASISLSILLLLALAIKPAGRASPIPGATTSPPDA
jgi:signal peptidase II